jgi:hypothetical protein
MCLVGNLEWELGREPQVFGVRALLKPLSNFSELDEERPGLGCSECHPSRASTAHSAVRKEPRLLC